MNKTNEDELSKQVEEFVRKSMLVILNARINSSPSNVSSKLPQDLKVTPIYKICYFYSSVQMNAKILT